jgi:predicted O-methyltransferase YrrM
MNPILSREKKNEKYKHTSLEMETSTHFPVLIKLAQMTTGPILELGSGIFSTPLLHWLCFRDKRRLLTIESYKHYLDFANKFKTDWHEVRFLDPRKEPVIEENFSIVFIDHSPKKPRTRGSDALLFKDKAAFIVLHDAGEDGHKKYGYDILYPEFKYRYDWKGCWPATTVLSNKQDISKLDA